MEPFVTYFLKVNGLLILFYASYYFLLRKETFFQTNRWFLLAGILSSLVLPLLTFTEVIWINPEPMVYNNNTAFIPINDVNYSTEAEPFNWNIVILSAYAFISCILLFKLVIELLSFFKIIKSGNRTKNKNIILVETSENQNPFSFFNYLVFNKVNFTEEELHLILIHEKVHIQQKHSIDVLISKFLCLVLWINPIVWLYRKAILENLEFIADNETSKISNKTYEYQKTLVKAVVCNNQLSITNQFYQSLIKKRIVMLNTNPSHRKNVWKYSIVIPALIAFVFLFQIKTVAQIRQTEKAVSEQLITTKISAIINSNTSDSDLKDLENIFSINNNKLKISKIKRDKDNQIIALKITTSNGKTNNQVYERKSDTPIKDIEIYSFTDENNIASIGFKEVTTKDQIAQPIEFVKVDNLKSDTSSSEKYWSMDNMTKDGKEVVLIINGKIKGATERIKLSLDEEISKMEEISPTEFKKKYNTKSDKNKIYYEIETKKGTYINALKKIIIDDDPVKNAKNNNSNDNYSINYGVTYETHSPEDNIKVNSVATIITLSPTEKIIKKYGEKASNGVIIIKDNEHKKTEKPETLSSNKDADFKLNGENESFVITKKSSNEDLNFYQSILKKSGFNMTYSNVKRNTKGEITQIHLKLDKNGDEIEKIIDENTGIEDILIGMQKGKPFIGLSPQKKEPKIIETADGDQIILFNTNMLKIPGEPTTRIENGKVDVYVNGKKLSNPETFLTMDHSKIYYLEVTDKETLENNVIKVKRIDVKTK